jgi:hypothetical protein
MRMPPAGPRRSAEPHSELKLRSLGVHVRTRSIDTSKRNMRVVGGYPTKRNPLTIRLGPLYEHRGLPGPRNRAGERELATPPLPETLEQANTRSNTRQWPGRSHSLERNTRIRGTTTALSATWAP